MSAVIKIDGKKYDFFTNLNITLKHADIASSFSFEAYYDPNNPDHRRLFKPFSYRSCVLETDTGQTILTGTILSHSFLSTEKANLVSVSGYSKTGVLVDSTIAASSYPLEKTNLSLLQVIREVCEPFGIFAYLSRDAPEGNEVFSSVVAKPTEKVAKFIIDLASQKGLAINHDFLGNIFIELESTFSKPVAFFQEGQPDLSISLQANGQGMNSEITAIKQASVSDDNSAEQSFNNPFVSSFRPLVKTQTSGTDSDTRNAAKTAVLSQLRNSLKVIVSLDRWEWRNESPELVTPNRIIEVQAPSAYLFEKTRLFVESVNLVSDTKKETAVLTCVIPEIFQGNDTIKNIFN